MGLLDDYIKRELDKGRSVRFIRKKLLEVGHDVGIVEKAIAKFSVKEEKNLIKFFLTVPQGDKRRFIR